MANKRYCLLREDMDLSKDEIFNSEIIAGPFNTRKDARDFAKSVERHVDDKYEELLSIWTADENGEEIDFVEWAM